MAVSCFDLRKGVSQNYVVSSLLEIIRMEGDTLLGFPYLTTKCYLVEKVCESGLFDFTNLPGGGVDSAVVRDAIVLIRADGLARVKEEGFATCMGGRDFRGIPLREHIDIHDEQIVHLYITPVVDGPGFQEWQRAVNQVTSHSHGSNWHTLSIATHLHSRLTREGDYLDTSFAARRQTAFAYIRKRAQVNKVSLPEGVFRDAFSLLDDLGLSVH